MFTLNKRFTALTLVVLLLLTAVAVGCGGQNKTESEDQFIKIGAIFDTSGPASSLGVPEYNTFKMIVEEINSKGGINGKQIKPVFYDSKSDEKEAVLAAKRMEQEKVAVVIGSSTTGTTLAMLDTLQKAEIPVISPASSAAIVTPAKDRQWVFKVPQSDTHIVEKIIEYLKAKNLSKVAFMSASNAFGENGLKAFEEAAGKNGITVLRKEKFDAKDTSMETQLTGIKGVNPEAVIVWSTPPAASIVTKNFRDLQLNVPLLHSHGVANKAFIETAGDGANGVIFPVGKILIAENLPDGDPQKEVLMSYIRSYEGKYGDMSRTTFGAHIWDALYMIKKAAEKAGSNEPSKIRSEMETLTNFVGLDGVFNLSPEDHNGLTVDALVLVEIKDGKWQQYNLR